MRVLVLAKKELEDIISEKIYIFTFFLQMFIIVGILLLGIFYSQINTTVNHLGNVYVVTDDASFLAQLERDKRINVVLEESKALVKVMLNDGKMTIEIKQEGIANEVEKIVREAYINKKYLWHESPNTYNTVYIEIMGSLFVPLILLLPIFISMNILSDSIIAEKERKTLEILLATPTSSTEIALGKVLPALCLSFVQIVIWAFLVRLRYLYIYNLALLFSFMILLSLLLFTIAIISSTIASNLAEANLFLTIFLMLMTFLMFVPQDNYTLFSSYSPLAIIVDISSNMGLVYEKIAIYFLIYGMLTFISIAVAARLLREDRYTRL